MKVAQYEVLGNDAKGNIRPDRDDRNVWLLDSHMRPRRRKESIDCPIRDGELFKNANPVRRGGYWATFTGSLRDVALHILPSLHSYPASKSDQPVPDEVPALVQVKNISFAIVPPPLRNLEQLTSEHCSPSPELRSERFSDFDVQIQCSAPKLKIVQRLDRFAFPIRRQVFDSRDNVSNRLLQIWLEIAPPNDSLLGLKVDETMANP
jgi:hypothetical protein